jgi:hypothetical protein
MLTYNCAGVNNDALSLLAFPILLLGLLRFLEGTRDYKTYFLVATGVFFTFFSKLTVGLVVVVMVGAVLLYTLIKERSCVFDFQTVFGDAAALSDYFRLSGHCL